MSNQVIQVENGVINTMVSKYQSQPAEELYMDIHEAVFPMAEKVAFGYFHKSKGLNVAADEFVQCARLAIFKAVEAFDISKGSNFTSLVKQLVQWTINDLIYKPAGNLGNKMMAAAVSFDKPAQATDGDYFIGEYYEYLVSENTPSILDAMLAEQDAEDYNSLTGIMLQLVQDFSLVAKADDLLIIKSWIGVALTQAENADNSDLSRLVNKVLSDVFPDVSSAALRKKKARAEERFNNFAQEQGYPSFKLSHF